MKEVKQMKMQIKRISSVICLFFMLTISTQFLDNIFLARTATHGEIEGIWQGTLKFSGMKLQIIFTINQDPTGKLIATMDVPEQNAVNISVNNLIVQEENVYLEISSIKGKFNGKLSNDGKTINGQWTQGGMGLPLVLKHSDTKLSIKRPQEPVEPFPYRVEEVFLENRDAQIKIAGTLTLPDSGGPFPAVMLLSGSGPQDRDEAVFSHRPFFVLADYLTRQGIAVIRFDDRGVGDSTGNFDEATAMDFVSDARIGVAYLKTRKDINKKAIGLIGHSEGGMIASMVAAQTSDVAFIVMIASPGLPIEEMEYSEKARVMKANGASEYLIAKNLSLLKNLFRVIREETDSKTVKNKFSLIISNFTWD